MSTPAPADRNLIFGLLALQMDFVSREQLLDAMNAWMLDKGTPLGDLLCRRGALGERRAGVLDALVDEHVAWHGGDPQASLAALRVEPAVRQRLDCLDDPDVQSSLASLPPSPAGRSSPAVDSVAIPATAAPAATAPSGVRYRRLREHAKGGLGEVFVALDEELSREVALKEIQGRFADHPNARSRFLREAQVTGKLEHPGVVPVYGLGAYPDGRPYYAMRLIRGESLQQAIARFHHADQSPRDPGERSLALRDLLSRFVAVCETVAYAHSRGILHRDLKPANVMLGAYGETLVVDWGLAKGFAKDEGDQPENTGRLPLNADAAVIQTDMGEAVGTPEYMPPEQANGKLDCLGPPSDVFALGATLYELLTGAPPYRGPDALAQAKRAMVPPARQRNRAVPAALEAVCAVAMAARSQDRYGSARALAEDVQRYLGDEPVSVFREPWGQRAVRWRRQHRTLVASVSVALLLAIAGIVGELVFWTANEGRRRRQADKELTALRESLQADEKIAIAELNSGRFTNAEIVLQQGVQRLQGKHGLDGFRESFARRQDRVRRLVEFFRLADEAERSAAESNEFYLYAAESLRPLNERLARRILLILRGWPVPRLLEPETDNSAALQCEAGLSQLGVLTTQDWRSVLPYEDLGPEQRKQLENEAYHQLLLLALLRTKEGVMKHGTPAAADAYAGALKAARAARYFHAESRVADILEFFCLKALGKANNAKVLASRPTTAADHFFVGILHYWLPEVMRNPIYGILLRSVGKQLPLDLQTPRATADRHFRIAAALEPKRHWTYIWLAGTLLAQGQPAAAELAFTTSIALRPDSPTGYQYRADALLALARGEKAPQAKKDLVRRAKEDLARAINLQPDLAPVRRTALLLRHIDRIARAGDYLLAAAEIDDLRRGSLSGSALYGLACLHTVNATSAARDTACPLPDRTKRAETYAQEAIGLLKQAATAGHFHDAQTVANLDKDDNLAFLRDRDDYRRFRALLRTAK
jgi:serine/threonine protein kinase